MSDGPEWFAPRRYGFGSGLPIAWQGWAVTLGFALIAMLISFEFGHRPLIVLAALAPLTVLLMVICAKTTRGGWKWRWGNED
ncbi:MAG TPA: hypothetical protein VM145_00755 [Sphingomicrobium sp.]|nr:hypothetical protein [Sphingomicrobium sp.]